MYSTTKLLTFGASLSCGFIILSSLLAVGYIFNDINNFYDNVISDMGEFKFYANDAWNEMILSTSSSSPRSSPIHSFVKRQASRCGCAQGPNHCPRGPSGPPGLAGEPGRDGWNGVDGQSGVYGMEMALPYLVKECISCPPGPPGPPGPDGDVGLEGKEGQKGWPGYPGKQGLYGRPGRQGEKGPSGETGRVGYPGNPGNNARAGKGLPGRPGPAGRRGGKGNRGREGERGEDGVPGPQGPPGYAGRRGDKGIDGHIGGLGRPGYPGSDAQYCPCPKRTQDMDVFVQPANGGYDAPQPTNNYVSSTPSTQGYDQPSSPVRQSNSFESQSYSSESAEDDRRGGYDNRPVSTPAPTPY